MKNSNIVSALAQTPVKSTVNAIWENVLDALPESPSGEIWTNGDDILVNSENLAERVANMLEVVYKACDESVQLVTGYFDPEEDKQNEEEDKCTGWWYINIG